MKKNKKGHLFTLDNYRPAGVGLWRGRTVAADGRGPQYWYQVARCLDWSKTSLPLPGPDVKAIALLGYAVDEGVRRNQGRAGAAEGPAAIRSQLARLAWHFGAEIELIDVGDIYCPDQDLPRAQAALEAAVHALLDAGYFPLVLGGGHDIAYGHFRSLRTHCAEAQSTDRLGIINFDAHFDLRRPTDGPNSGTPFYQLATESNSPADFRYCVVGLQAAANPPELMATAKDYAVTVIPVEAMNRQAHAALSRRVLDFAATCDRLYITIDMDGFSAAYAPGVSAPSPVGFLPDTVLALLDELFATGKIASLDIAELNPRFDRDEHTARLAARLIYGVAQCYASR